MKITFDKGFLCGGCKRRYGESQIAYKYKESCICKRCFDNFKSYSKEAYFGVSDEVEFLVSAFHYKSIYRKIFLDFKFNGQFAYGHVLGMAMAEVLKERDVFSDYQYIVTVPVSKERFAERGYNQSEVLAEYISKAIDIPINNALVRIKHSAPQSTVHTSLRAKNVKGAYLSTETFNGENIIIFDDICTTGSTVTECARTLKRAGAGKICVISGAHNVQQWIDRTIHRFI